MKFYGLYIRNIDESGRVTLPPKFREGFKEGVALLASLKDKALRCAPPSLVADQRLVATKQPAPFYASEPSGSLRFMDRRGRVNIPQYLCKHAEISQNVVIAGMGHYLELWSENNWRNTLPS